MLALLIEKMQSFLLANAALIIIVMSIVEYVKRWVESSPWYKPEFMTAFGFILGFAFAIPATGFVGIAWTDFVAQGFGLGLVATGIYKVGSTLASK